MPAPRRGLSAAMQHLLVLRMSPRYAAVLMMSQVVGAHQPVGPTERSKIPNPGRGPSWWTGSVRGQMAHPLL